MFLHRNLFIQFGHYHQIFSHSTIIAQKEIILIRWKPLSTKYHMKESVGMDLFLVMMESLHPKRVQKRSLHKKQTDLEGRTPVKGKEIKANAKGKCSEDLKVNEEETFEKPTKPNVRLVKVIKWPKNVS